MNYRSLLVHLGADAQGAVRVDLAIRMARRHDCHLVGLATVGEIQMPAVHDAPGTHAELEALVWDTLRTRAEAAADQFRNACGAAGFKAYEVVVDEGDPGASLVGRAHCSDLVIVGQAQPNASPGALRPNEVEQVVLDSARPTLLVPHAGRFDTLDRSALVAWDDSRESARAVLDAVPLLRACERVQVVEWTELRHGGPRSADMSGRLTALQQWLLWHGVSAEVRAESTELPVAEALLSRASDLDSDLVVMGAYGHTRMSERILGGATRTLLQSMTVPVLMSH